MSREPKQVSAAPAASRAAQPSADPSVGPSAGLAAGAERRTAGGPRAIGAMLDRLIGRAGQRRGFGEARILTEWPAIVGPELAACTLPERIARARGDAGGVLHLRVRSGWATTVQHMVPVILERINGFLGYGAVVRAPPRPGAIAPPRRRGPPPRRPLTPQDRAQLDDALRSVADPDLAAALRALGEAVLARTDAGRADAGQAGPKPAALQSVTAPPPPAVSPR